MKDIAGEQSVLAKNLTTSGVTLSTNTRESDGAVTGYVARETITIIENNVERVNAILSPIIDAQIIESYEVTYSIRDASAAYDGALAAAMADAQEKAAAIAEAGGVTLGPVVSGIGNADREPAGRRCVQEQLYRGDREPDGDLPDFRRRTADQLNS